ncbi:MAG: CcoQ/FixQ family Cbb3-type cytochrome c oxidase assembly chaperone [Bacteroidales bacterium]|nr:CcoQ/FixQ family Cbb3-type cytochrome c oxidase assembly chaperone [Bacteroidales bacterium]
MTRLLNQFIESVDGIEIYLIISLLLFLGIFVLITIWAFSLKKSDVEKMKEIPFDE